MIINAENLIVGRLGTFAAKSALLGEDVIILNAEKAVFSGKKSFIMQSYKQKRERGTFKGPFIQRDPALFVKRAIRGMLPYKKDRGMNALKRIKCYVGIPDKYKDAKMITIKDADSTKVKDTKCVKVELICKTMGAKL